MADKREPRNAEFPGTGRPEPALGSVDEVMATYPTGVQKLAEELRGLVKRTVPRATEAVKWGKPVFEHQGKGLCYLQGHKEYVRFGFFEQASRLDDPEGLLQGTGKAMRHVKVRSKADIRPTLKHWLQQIAAMNEQRGRED